MMDRTHFILYFLVFCFGSLSVYNFFNNHAHLEETKRESTKVDPFIQQQRYRQRRNVENDDKWKIVFDLKIEKLTRFVKTTANETIQEEFEKVLKKLKKEIPNKCLCDHKPTNCQPGSGSKQRDIQIKDDPQEHGSHGNRNDGSTTSKVICPQGPRGPPGPIGPPGKRGLGIEKPILVNSALNIVANETDDVTFECVFFGYPIPSVEWESDSFNIDQVSNTIDKEKSQITSRLTVSKVDLENSGQVACVARNILGAAASSGYLVVNAAPIINMYDGPLFVPRGINYQFQECKVRAYPKAKITWKRFFWSLPEGRYSTNDGFLNISRVRYDDDGFYICEAENFLGKAVKKVQMKTKNLKMHDKPLPNLRGLTEVNITCSAYGNPDKMSGQITRIDGTRQTEMKSVINKTENLFTMTALAKKSTTYSCSIKFEEDEIKSYTSVQMFEILDSEILKSQSDIQLLGEWLKEYYALGKYARCYYSKTDGKSFYEKCGGMSHTITLVKYLGYHYSYKIAGGYTDVTWEKPMHGNRFNNRISNSTNTFIFDMKEKRKYDAIPGSSTTVCYKPYGPCFGNNEFYSSCCPSDLHWKFSPTFGMYIYRSRFSSDETIEVFYRL